VEVLGSMERAELWLGAESDKQRQSCWVHSCDCCRGRVLLLLSLWGVPGG
jgi:hypothetical protein